MFVTVFFQISALDLLVKKGGGGGGVGGGVGGGGWGKGSMKTELWHRTTQKK